jgi:hypothetical protein
MLVAMTTSLAPSPALFDESLALAAIPSPVPPTFRLRPIMRQGTASSVAETWTRFASVEDARRAVKSMYHDDRVLRVFVVDDEAPPRFVEWIER